MKFGGLSPTWEKKGGQLSLSPPCAPRRGVQGDPASLLPPSQPRVSSRNVPTEEPSLAPGTSLQHQTISIKSERVSPGLGTPQPPLASLVSLGEASRGPGDLQQRDDYTKGYPCPMGTPRPLAEEQRVPVPARRAQAMDTWQR